ncbi:hypothetical protein FGO68_gene10212 [Halteria grandinella]|uniref:TRP C-terminal domain-containing protein n=1 Tax=Halteria grandinella TaxID=5974 RepID=A0A8J8P5L9_HALGN|nr:hypothetical protein FGO68_gene10212 [Halteria grandinella]
MSSIINISSFKLSEIKSKSFGVIFNYALSVIILGILIIIIAGFFFIIRRQMTTDVNHNLQLIDGINIKKGGIAAYWTVLTIVRWFILSVVLIFFTDNPGAQLLLMMPLSIISTIAQAILSPQAARADRLISIFNEVMASIYIYTLVGLALAEEISAKNVIGLLLLLLIILTIFANIMKPMILGCSVCVKKCKNKVQKSSDRVITLQHQKYEAKSEENSFEIPIKQKSKFRLESYVKRSTSRFIQKFHSETSQQSFGQ